MALDHIQRMSERYEHNVTVESVLKSSEKLKGDLNEVHQLTQQRSGQAQNQTEEQATQPTKK